MPESIKKVYTKPTLVRRGTYEGEQVCELFLGGHDWATQKDCYGQPHKVCNRCATCPDLWGLDWY